MNWLSGKKTYLVAIGAIVAIVWNALVMANFNLKGLLAALDWKSLMEAIAAITMRAGIAKA